MIPCIDIHEWDARYASLKSQGLIEPWYGGSLRRHVQDGDLRLLRLRFDSSPAALRLWNFLLTEEDRLAQAKDKGCYIVGAMKDLGTIPVIAYSLPNLITFYPDGAWWIPCVMELSTGLFEVADMLGIDDSFCPVRAMLGAFVTQAHFPIPDLLVCNTGAVCDDFSAIAQRVQGLGHPIFWWESPHRRHPLPDEPSVALPGGMVAPQEQIFFLKAELLRVSRALEDLSGYRLHAESLQAGIKHANRTRGLLAELRWLAYTAEPCPLPALEMLIAEMLALHYCSDAHECPLVLLDLLEETRRRVDAGEGVLPGGEIRVFWVNPVADIKVMNLLEAAGARICGTDYLFTHTLDAVPENIDPLEALARSALADPMTGPAQDRASRIIQDMRRFGSEALIISRIPGASHCATEGQVIKYAVCEFLGLPVLELEIPPVSDALEPAIQTRLEALVETARSRRDKSARH